MPQAAKQPTPTNQINTPLAMSASPVKSSTVEEERGGGDTTTAINNKDEILQVGEKIYQSLDPLDPRKIALDIFEVYCHEMLWTKFIGRRAYLIIKMRVSFVV